LLFQPQPKPLGSVMTMGYESSVVVVAAATAAAAAAL
jgi:hypothetical protein